MSSNSDRRMTRCRWLPATSASAATILVVLDGHAAIAGHGIAILSPPIFKCALDAGLLIQPFPEVAANQNAFWLVYAERKRELPNVRALRGWLLAQVPDAADDDKFGILEPFAPV